MSPGRESDIASALFTKIYINDYEKLCNTDILGLRESNYRHDDCIYEKFKKPLKKDKGGWYETGLVWKKGNLPLGNNKNGSLGRPTSLVKLTIW